MHCHLRHSGSSFIFLIFLINVIYLIYRINFLYYGRILACFVLGPQIRRSIAISSVGISAGIRLVSQMRLQATVC